jgi:hypothetical protein
MLSTAHRVLDGDEYANEMGLYKLAHKNHPSTIWVRTSSENYRWLFNHYDALMQEYTYRYDKTHATSRLRDALNKTPDNIPSTQYPNTDPPQCMPEECKGEDTVLAYQTYYIIEKSSFAKWKRREIPEWFNEKNSNLESKNKEYIGFVTA